jgi:transposase
MKITRGYKTELDLNNKQRTACLQHAGAARYAYKWGLARKIEAYKKGEKVPTAIGVDLGVTTLATCSDGATFANPRPLKHKLKKLKRFQRAHSRKQKGSKNREKSRKKYPGGEFDRQSKRLWSGKLWLLSNE